MSSPRLLRGLAWISLAALFGAAAVGLARSDSPPAFASRIGALSESSGAFDTDNLISNERSYLEVMPQIAESGVSGGAYIGVGPDQNFSYIARIRPAIAYIIDIRRDNLLLHLLFKALFAAAPTRIEYLGLLIGRAPPDTADAWQDAPFEEMLDRLDDAERRPRDELRHEIESRIRGFGVPLTASDFDTIARFHAAFMDSGFELQFRSHGRPPVANYPTFRQLLLATDANGQQWNYLATDDAYQVVRDLQARDAIVPVVGNVSGAHAVQAIAADMATEGQTLSAFYVSNVEDYLFQNGSFGRFADNLRHLPRTPRSIMIRSIFRGRPSASIIQPLDDLLAQAARNEILTYRDLLHGAPARPSTVPR